MTISEEKKLKILTLYKKGVSKKDISILEKVSYPSIRSILSSDDIEEIQEEKKEIVVKKLTEIFTYENRAEETMVNLIFGLKRIGEKSGKDLGDFVEDLVYIFDCYDKITEDTIKLFVFLLEISRNMTVIADHIEPLILIDYIDNFIDREVDMEDAEKYVAEIKEEAENVWNETQKRIENVKRKAINEIEVKSETLLTNSKEEYAEYQEKINRAKEELTDLILNKIFLNNRNEKVKKENQELKKTLKESDEKKTLLEKAFKKLGAIFPQEAETIIQEIIKESRELENDLQH